MKPAMRQKYIALATIICGAILILLLGIISALAVVIWCNTNEILRLSLLIISILVPIIIDVLLFIQIQRYKIFLVKIKDSNKELEVCIYKARSYTYLYIDDDLVDIVKGNMYPTRYKLPSVKCLLQK